MSALFECQGDTVPTGTGKVYPTRKFKCTTAARVRLIKHECDVYVFLIFFFGVFFESGLRICAAEQGITVKKITDNISIIITQKRLQNVPL